MGTGVTSALVHNFPYGHGSLVIRIFTLITFFLNLVLFILISGATAARYALFPDVWSKMLHHPAQSLFVGAVPMGFATLINIALVSDTTSCTPLGSDLICAGYESGNWLRRARISLFLVGMLVDRLHCFLLVCIWHGAYNVRRRSLPLHFPLIAWQVEHPNTKLFKDGNSMAFTSRHSHRRVVHWWFAIRSPPPAVGNACFSHHGYFLHNGHHRTQSRNDDDHCLSCPVDYLRSARCKLDPVCLYCSWTVRSGRLLVTGQWCQPCCTVPCT